MEGKWGTSTILSAIKNKLKKIVRLEIWKLLKKGGKVQLDHHKIIFCGYPWSVK